MSEAEKSIAVKVPMLAKVLVVIAWFWTAYECDTIGIDVFDMLLKRFPGQVWIMAAVLSYLTIIWMPKNLLTRAVMGIFMLIPAELFKVTRPLVPDSGFAPIQIVVVLAYVLAVIGMYGMFYPWRIEAALKRLGFSAVGNDAKIVFEPGDDCARAVNVALEGVEKLAVGSESHRGHESLRCCSRLLADVHHYG